MKQAMVKCADVFQFLADVPSNSVDLIVTDYAYESLEKHRKTGTTTRLKESKMSSNKWFPILENCHVPRLLSEFYRVLKPGTHLYMNCDDETSNILWQASRQYTKFKWWKRLTWDKCAMGMGYHWRARTEFIAFMEKGPGRRLNSNSESDLIKVKRIRGGYPTEKPPELFKALIENSSEPGQLVLDPFCGSGASGVAALELGRRFLGCDIEQDAVDLTIARCKAVSSGEKA